MKIIIAPDSFKGSLTALEATTSIKKGIKKACPEARTISLPVGDGGEGTMEVLINATAGQKKSVPVIGPIGDEIEAEYGILGDGKTCVIEMATASGLHLVPNGELAPLKATTYGTGQLMKQALDDGFTSFIVTVGGSATNDGGAGMLLALGMQLLDSHGEDIDYGGEELNKIVKIDSTNFDARIQESTFIIATDVSNPLIGPNGASYVFGGQKGATDYEIKLLDNHLKHWANKVYEKTNVRIHDIPGAGAAGGIGGAFKAFFSAELKPGIEVVLDYIDFNKHLADADLVITGEGKVDHQTVFGKTAQGVAQAANKQNVPTIIMAGAVENGFEKLYDYGVVSVNSIIRKPMSLNEAIKNASTLLEKGTEQVIRTYTIS